MNIKCKISWTETEKNTLFLILKLDKISLRDISKEMNIPSSTLSDYVNGIYDMPIEIYEQIINIENRIIEKTIISLGE